MHKPPQAFWSWLRELSYSALLFTLRTAVRLLPKESCRPNPVLVRLQRRPNPPQMASCAGLSSGEPPPSAVGMSGTWPDPVSPLEWCRLVRTVQPGPTGPNLTHGGWQLDGRGSMTEAPIEPGSCTSSGT